MKARPRSEYHDDMGDVLWWRFPITEAPYVGTPFDCGLPVEVSIEGRRLNKSMRVHVGGWPGYHTHWTPLPTVEEPAS